ncbi:MAG: ubiquinone/menaquinone biosynthesis methyltransferase [Solirubrobacteraceae bacterium]
MPVKDGAATGVLDAGEVRAMFDRIAGVYDLLNGAMTAGLHHRWRTLAAAKTGLRPGESVLDVATGTGDLAFELARLVQPGGRVLGTDFSEAMLERARAKREGAAESGDVRFEWADAMSLPYADDSFDAATVGFGARNFSDLTRGLSEMARVVRPGGRVVVLEITTPVRPPLSVFYALWFDRIVPLLGALAGAFARMRRVAAARRGRGGPLDAYGGAGSARAASIGDAYTYLPSSVKRFPGPLALAAEMESAGLTEITWLLTAGGIIAIHAGIVHDGSLR